MLSLHSNNNVSISLTQLGGVNGLRLLGSLRGVLPIGPNGATDFDTVPASSFKDAMTAPDLFYDYTLELQGVFNNVTCAYTHDPASIPIKYKTRQGGIHTPCISGEATVTQQGSGTSHAVLHRSSLLCFP
jgi:hypothetical protein